VAAARVAHAHEVVGGAVLRPLLARRMSGASVVASSGAAAAICDRRPASGSGRRAPKWWARGSVLGGRQPGRASVQTRWRRGSVKEGSSRSRCRGVGENHAGELWSQSRGAQGKGTGFSDSGSG
jgi:hypothetical protein